MLWAAWNATALCSTMSKRQAAVLLHLGMLQVVAMRLGHAAIHSQLDPGNLVHQPACHSSVASQQAPQGMPLPGAASTRAYIRQSEASQHRQRYCNGCCNTCMVFGTLSCLCDPITFSSRAAKHAPCPVHSHGTPVQLLRHASLLGLAHSRVAPLSKQLESKSKAGIDDPHKEVAMVLQLWHWQIQDVLIRQLIVPQSHPCSRRAES